MHVFIFLHSQPGVLPTWQGEGGGEGEGEEEGGGGGRRGRQKERGGRQCPPVCNTSVTECVLAVTECVLQSEWGFEWALVLIAVVFLLC